MKIAQDNAHNKWAEIKLFLYQKRYFLLEAIDFTKADFDE